MSSLVLDEQNFRRCCQNLLQQSEQLRDGWSWEAVQGSEEGYLKKTALRSVVFDSTQVWDQEGSGSDTEPHKEQSVLVASVDADNIQGDIDDEDEDEDEDDGVCTVSEGSSQMLQYEYHILHSCSYATPVLYFRAFTQEGRSLSLEEVWSSVHPNFRHRLQNSPLNTISLQEHPLLGQPFFMLHPCRTEEFMRPVLQAAQDQHSELCVVVAQYCGSCGGSGRPSEVFHPALSCSVSQQHRARLSSAALLCQHHCGVSLPGGWIIKWAPESQIHRRAEDTRTVGGTEQRERMVEQELNQRDNRNIMEERTRPQSNRSGPKQDLYLGCLTKQQLIIISVAVGLVVLVIIITVAAVVSTKSGSSAPPPSFSTDGDMLDFLVQSGDIGNPDGLLATWFHRANSKEDMNKALTSGAMILEADITLEGYGTPSEKPIPIMAHPPAITSDNTLDQWLDAVLASRKGMKLDFKSLRSVGLSLDLLSQKNINRGINRPVWLNADILQGPNVPDFLPPINGTRFLQVIQEKFPNVTLSPGWKVAYVPPLLTGTYTRSMVEEMFDMIKDVPQKVTFPVHALLVRSGWQHLSWLLSQSPRFSLTLWQGSIHPNISDLLFVRENSHPARVYYDIYEPTLSAFKQAAKQQGLLRRFYSGGNLMNFLYPVYNSVTQRSSLELRWFRVTDRTSLLAQLSGGDGGMLVVHVASDSNRPGVPLVEGSTKSSEAVTLQDVLQLLGQRAAAPWGVHLRIHTQQLLEASLKLLHSAHRGEKLYRPVWISMEGLQTTDTTKEFVSSVERLFPYVTIVLEPPLAAVISLSQRVALHLNTASLPQGQDAIDSLMGMMERYDLLVEEDTRRTPGAFAVFKGLVSQQRRENTHLYVIPAQS